MKFAIGNMPYHAIRFLHIAIILIYYQKNNSISKDFFCQSMIFLFTVKFVLKYHKRK